MKPNETSARREGLATELRFALFGVLFGAAFPICGLLFDRLVMGTSFTTFADALRQNPIHGIVTMAPFVLGVTFWRMGRMYASVKSQARRARFAERRLWTVAHRDNLTGRGNRYSLTLDLEKLLGSGEMVHVLLIDLDKFKLINDTLGHHIGDELLRALACRIGNVLDHDASIYRLGGDEFVVVARHCDRDGAGSLAQRILATFEQPFGICGVTVVTGCSIGIAEMEPGDREIGRVLSRADLALYTAKLTYGNSLTFFHPEMSEDANMRIMMEQDIRRGLTNKEFFLEFQPIVGIAERQVRGFEALLRWQHPARGLISPEEFVPIAEVSGQIVALGEYALNLACREAAGWPMPLSVSVNVSVEQFKHRYFYDQVMGALDRHGLSSGRLVLEMTELVFILDTVVIGDVFNRLKRAGVRLALDDFGTGYSSINHLRNLHFDFLKLDKSFSASIETDERERELVRTVIDLGRQFQLTTTIEGVETESQLAFMQSHGVNEAQGFLIARPLPAADIGDFLKTMAAPGEAAASAKTR